MKIVAVIVLALLLSASAHSQQPKTSSSDDDVVRIDLNLIQVDAVVTDKNGRQVTNLTASDFSIIENGKSHLVDYCTYVPLSDNDNSGKGHFPSRPPSKAELQRTFVFLVDNPRIEFVTSYANVSSSPSASFYFLNRAIRGAVEAERLLTWFVDSEVGAHDLVAIGDTEVNLGVLSSFTNDRAALRYAIHQIRNNPTSGRAPIIKVTLSGGGLGLAELVNQNLRVIETLSNVINQLETLPGRKAITLLSRGMLFNPQFPGANIVIERMKRLIDQANRARVSIYALSPAGVGNFGGETLQNFDSLIHLAKETGGRAIYNTNDTRVGFAEIVEKTRGYYLLGYKAQPDTHARPHAIKVQLNHSDFRVEARTTAYSHADSLRDPASSTEALLAAINSPLRQTDIPLEIIPTFVSAARRIDLAVKVGLTEADLANTNELIKAEFDLALRITGPEGKLLPPSIHQLALTARAEDRDRALHEGITTHFQIPVETSGFYRISIAVQNKRTGELGSNNSLIEAVDSSRKKQ